MVFRFPSGAKRKPPLSGVKPKLLPHTSTTLPDILWTSMITLRDSADTFPPLKSAVGGVMAICDLAERAKHSKSEACAIALRTKEILDLVADAVPDGSRISPPMLLSIEKFSILLDKIRCSMEAITLTGRVSRIMHLNRNERALEDIKSKLDDAYRDFLAASALRIEVQQAQLVLQQTQFAIQQTELAKQQIQIHREIKTVSAESARLLFYARFTSFFGRPLMLPYKGHTRPIHLSLSLYEASVTGILPGVNVVTVVTVTHHAARDSLRPLSLPFLR
ncbi:hypothetical protein B0H14DRAFT_2844829 [Mycena olivaceomarginata]|nr:hypothetical protein B0H14DRAFT_2844829 [Mycena olivaceomarginata]